MINFDGYMVDGKHVSFPRVEEIEYYKKGGKIRKRRRNTGLKQKQKQTTNIKIKIGSLSGGKQDQAPMPRIITQYMGGAQPVNLTELISKMNAIEEKVSNQQPLSFMNDILKSEFTDALKDRIKSKDDQKQEVSPSSSSSSSTDSGLSSSSSSSSSAASASSTSADNEPESNLVDTGITWEGVKILTNSNGKLMYMKEEAGKVTQGYLSKFASSGTRANKLTDLYQLLDDKNIPYTKIARKA